MQWFHWAMIIIGILGFALQTVILSVSVTWALGNFKAEIVAYVSKYKAEHDEALRKAITDRDSQIGTLARSVDETGHALRTKIHEVETWTRDTFVRRDSFMNLITEAKRSEERREAKYDEQLQIILDKIDDLRDKIITANSK